MEVGRYISFLLLQSQHFHFIQKSPSVPSMPPSLLAIKGHWEALVCWQRQAGVRWLLLHNTQLFSHLALIAARHLGKWLLDGLDLKLLILMVAFPFIQWCWNVLQRWSCSKRFALRRECISHKNSWVLKTRSIAPSLEIGVIANILQIFMITDYGKMWQCTSLCVNLAWEQILERRIEGMISDTGTRTYFSVWSFYNFTQKECMYNVTIYSW